MNVRVRYFAAFREAAGIEAEVITTQADSPSTLFTECSQKHKGLRAFSAALVAINDEMTPWDSALQDGDEVLFFPPVAGG